MAWQGGLDHVLAGGLSLDALSLSMVALVSLVGITVGRVGARALQGDPARGRFLRHLAATVACVLVLVMSGNLLILTLAWIGTSLCLHRLLLFYPARAAARRAAAKKFIVSRLGDLCLIAAVALCQWRIGSLAIADVIAAPAHLPHAQLAPIALLLASAALLKSAQFPAHVWLPEVLDTPTPVSALLHAGIINAGGFLIIRFAPLMLAVPEAMLMLAVFGAISALLGAAVTRAQPAVKTQLAWSTVAQMGFMMLQCGLGAFSGALIHLVLHGLYKAHAFLGSGNVLLTAPAARGHARPLPVIAALVLPAAAALAGIAPPADLAAAAIMMVGLAGLLRAQSLAGLALEIVLLLAIGAATALLHMAGGVYGLPAPSGNALQAGLGFAVAALGAGIVLMPLYARRWPAIFVHVQNGFYLGVLSDRLVARAAVQEQL